jgi:predicted nucleic acid-binding protein
MVFDTSVLVEIVNGSELGLKLKPRLEGGAIVPHLTDVNLFELRYLICRRVGWNGAAPVIEMLRNTGYFDVHGVHEFLDEAARLKCERALSIVDYMTIAAGVSLGIPVLYARHETELDAEMKRRPFEVELRFLTDIS